MFLSLISCCYLHSQLGRLEPIEWACFLVAKAFTAGLSPLTKLCSQKVFDEIVRILVERFFILNSVKSGALTFPIL